SNNSICISTMGKLAQKLMNLNKVKIIMKLKVKLFGHQAQLTNKREIDIELNGASAHIAQVRQALGEKETALLDSLPVSRLAVNHEFSSEQKKVQVNDEIALIGLISGG